MVFYALMLVPYAVILCGEAPQKARQLRKQVMKIWKSTKVIFFLSQKIEVIGNFFFFFEVIGNLRTSNVVKALTNLWTQASLPFTGVEMATKS